ncbi:hypothetical protein [uncultured Bacteroides sp.]|uniref:hypothetical protein n=1 Tax=uncultured Bacteroides sp. TaxID=162156 RepID=UPI002AA77C0E|nr:hypothetical protein [uncultured Bacteroides sp.]
MEKKLVTKEVYISSDGIEFTNEDECRKHESIFSNIKYFKISHTPDLNETGLYTHKTYVAVYSANGCHREVAIDWATRTFSYLCSGVQGIGFMPSFNVSDSNKKEWVECEPTKWGGMNLANKAIFLSPIEVHYMGENIDYMDYIGLKNSIYEK